jgi:hypothetical protein
MVQHLNSIDVTDFTKKCIKEWMQENPEDDTIPKALESWAHRVNFTVTFCHQFFCLCSAFLPGYSCNNSYNCPILEYKERTRLGTLLQKTNSAFSTYIKDRLEHETEFKRLQEFERLHISQVSGHGSQP